MLIQVSKLSINIILTITSTMLMLTRFTGEEPSAAALYKELTPIIFPDLVATKVRIVNNNSMRQNKFNVVAIYIVSIQITLQLIWNHIQRIMIVIKKVR